MEAKIMADFARKDDLMRAVDALRLQGVIDISYEEQAGMPAAGHGLVEFAEEPLYAPLDHSGFVLRVLAEKSRTAQAEATIRQFNGQF